MKTQTVYKSGMPFKVSYHIVNGKLEVLEVYDVLDQDCACMCEAFGLWDIFKELVAEKL